MHHPPHFAGRCSAEQVEEGYERAPKFDADGLLPCITADAANDETLANSGLVPQMVEMRIDVDQNALWLRVRVQARPHSDRASCHVGYGSCYDRSVEPGNGRLRFVEAAKTFAPRVVHGDATNATVL